LRTYYCTPTINFIVLVFCALFLFGCDQTTAKKPYGAPNEMMITQQTQINYLTVHYYALRTCMICHENRTGPYFPTYETLVSNITEVKNAITGNEMPPRGDRFSSLDACQKLVLNTWVTAGMPLEGGPTLGAPSNACY